MMAIFEKGEFVWDTVNKPELKDTLKELMWKEFIVRKKDNGLNANVFVLGWFKDILLQDFNSQF